MAYLITHLTPAHSPAHSCLPNLLTTSLGTGGPQESCSKARLLPRVHNAAESQ